MKIIITESQFKRLVENIINEKEEHDIFDDPKAIALVDFLNKTEDKEYGMTHIEKVSPYYKYGMVLYYMANNKEYIVGTNKEVDKTAFYIGKEMLYDDIFYLSNETIINNSSVLTNNKISHQLI